MRWFRTVANNAFDRTAGSHSLAGPVNAGVRRLTGSSS
jgi:hypothetical protein